MMIEPRRIKVAAGSELARLLAAADATPVILDNDGDLYRLDRMEHEPKDLWEGYDPGKAKKAIAATVGSWKDLDAEALIADVRRAREEGSRPASRP